MSTDTATSSTFAVETTRAVAPSAGINRRRLLLGGLASLATAGAVATLSAPRASAAEIGTTLRPGQQLNPGDNLRSASKQFLFSMQTDGNAVLYDLYTGAALWSTRSDGVKGASFANQTDGNLVCYTPGRGPGYGFTSGTNGAYGTGDLVLQDDGNLVRYGGPSGWAWASGTNNGTSQLNNPAGVRAPLPSTNRTEQLLSFARAQIGKPYISGAVGPNAYDCSGLTQTTYKFIGITLGRTTYDQIKNGRSVSQAQLQPGDLVFPNAGHVALYSGGGRWIEAAKPGTNVREVTMWGFWAARRIL